MSGPGSSYPGVAAVPLAGVQAVLAAAVRHARQAHPLAPVTIVTPNRYGALGLRRALARELGGLLDVRFVTAPTLTEVLGSPALRAAGRNPATPAVRAEALRAVLAASSGSLAEVRHHPGARAAINAALGELAALPQSARSACARASAVAAELVDLDARLRRRLARWYDTVDLTHAAIERITADGIPSELGTVVVVLPRPGTVLDGALLRALHGAGAGIVVGFTGDPLADQAAHALCTELGASATVSPAAATPIAADVVLAPDPEGEARAAVQRVAAAIEQGVPLHRIAITTRLPSPYMRVVRERLRIAGIPWSGPADRTLGDTAAGRVLAGYLTATDGWLRNTVAAWCAGAPVLESPDGTVVPAHRFDVLSRAAGVVHGLDQWRERLPTHARRRHADAANLAADPDASEGAAIAATRDAHDAERLLEFIERVAASSTPPSSDRWEDHAAWAHGLLEAFVAVSDAWPEDDVRAAQDLAARIDTLGALDAVGESCTPERFRAALDHELATPLGPIGRFGDGVFVGTLQSMLGLQFDLVIVVGANDRELPPTRRDDPLLPDSVRRAAGGALPTHDDRMANERHDWMVALHGAPHVVITCSRADTRAMRERRPARWLLELIEARVGHPVGANDLETLDVAWCTVVPSFTAAVTTPTAFADSTERDLATAALAADAIRQGIHPLLDARPQLAHAVSALRARLHESFTEFDGLVGPHGTTLADRRAFSPTALELYARCPRSYLFEKVLHLEEVPRPETVDRMLATDRGKLVHAVLERFVAEAGPQPAGYQWTATDRDRLFTVGAELFAEYSNQGLTGRRVPSELSRRQLRRTLARWLVADNVFRARHGVAPTMVEHAFGFGDVAPVAVAAGAERTLKLRGRIDRIDASADGRHVVVVDYKTGSADSFSHVSADAPIGHADHLQLPVYARAAQAVTGADTVAAYFVFVSAAKPADPVGYEVTDSVLATFDHAVQVIADGIDHGVFPGRPGVQDSRFQTFEHCRWCAFDRVCPTTRDAEWERVRVTGQLEEYLQITEDSPEVERP